MADKPGKPNLLYRQIDQNLKQIFDDLVEEDVPDRFSRLLEQLREQDRAGGDAESDK